MSVIIAIFQAIFQAITYILPVSQSGHSSVFHDFAGRADGTTTMLTGAISLGIAIGIFVAVFKLFARLGKECVGTVTDIVHKDFNIKNASYARRFLFMLVLSYVPMLLWLLPLGSFGNSYRVLRATAYNGTLLDEGVFFAVTGVLVFLAARQLTFNRNKKQITLPAAVTAGVCSLFFVPVSGLALIGGPFCVLVLFGVSCKAAYKYSLVFSVPVLLISGISQLVRADYKSSVVAMIIGFVLAAAVAFLVVRVVNNIIKKGLLKYIAYYDVSMGVIVAVIGAIQLAVR